MIERGGVVARSLEGDPDLRYFVYVPQAAGPDAPVFVSVHGRGRAAQLHADLFAPFAERHGVVLVAPLFTRERFPDFHCLGRRGQGERSDLALTKILTEVETLTGARIDRIHLFGYSGGGQFAHRYTMAHPERVVRMVAGAPGWFTFPDPTRMFPLGIMPAAALPGVSFDPARFLAVPILVVVGDGDTERTESLNQAPEIDTQQGTTRVERAQRWVAAMRAAAAERGQAPRCEIALLPRVAHSFAACMATAGMGETVFAHLWPRAPRVPA